MSEEKKPEAKPDAAAADGAAPAKRGNKVTIILTVVGILCTGAAAGAASFMGAKRGQRATVEVHCPGQEAEAGHGGGHEAPPGPTVALEPFVINPTDKGGKLHAAKITFAVEFAPATKEEHLKPLTPRIRDSILSFLRTLPFEEVADHAHTEKWRKHLLEKMGEDGVTGVKRVLLTDLVVQ